MVGFVCPDSSAVGGRQGASTGGDIRAFSEPFAEGVRTQLPALSSNARGRGGAVWVDSRSSRSDSQEGRGDSHGCRGNSRPCSCARSEGVGPHSYGTGSKFSDLQCADAGTSLHGARPSPGSHSPEPGGG